MSPDATPVPRSGRFARAHRPFFLAACLYAALAVPLWWAEWAGLLPGCGGCDPVARHAHEMLMGFAGAVLGGIIGAIIGVVTDHGVSGADSELYAEGLKRGGTLVTATIDDGMTAKATELLKKHSAAKVEERAADWTAEGWVSLDVGHAEPAGGLATA